MAEAARNGDAGLPAGTAGVGALAAVPTAPGMGPPPGSSGPRQAASWAGPCPAACRPGNLPHAGRIKGMGPGSLASRAVRGAADTAARHDAGTEAAYASARRRHADRHGPAVIAAAHKAVTMMRHGPAARTPRGSSNEGPCRRRPAGTGKARRGRPPALPASGSSCQRQP